MTKVLLIEDSEADASQIVDLLRGVERDSFEVTCVDSVEAGVEQFAEESFDAVLLEYHLAGGHDVSELANLKDLAPMLPVVLLCTREERDLACLVIGEGAEDYVEENHRSGELLARSILWAIERVDAAARLAFLSRNDPLTGLVNRAVFRDRVLQTLARSDRNQTSGALLLVDLDSFKAVNDAYGNDTGDLLLQHVATQLRNTVRPYDVVARLGGDDFGVLLEDVVDSEEAGAVSARLLEAIAMPLTVGDREMVSTVSIGAALFPSDGTELGALLRSAGFALDRAKRQGGAAVSFYMDVFGPGHGQRVAAS